MGYFTQLKKELEKYLTPVLIAKVHKAYLLAFKAHRGQKRVNGESYISHPVAAAIILASMRMDHQSLMATLLHDVLEDTNVSRNVLIAEFGQEVVRLVDGVSKLKQIKFNSKAEAQAENFRRMILAMADDIRVILVKLADRLHNMRTIQNLPIDKRVRISIETLEIYAPIANRLGMHAFYTELEDLGLKTLHPMRYRVLLQARSKVYGGHEKVMNQIQQKLEQTIRREGLDNFLIQSREKHLYSIYRKMRYQHKFFSNIMDMYGFRIIVDNMAECYRILGIVHSLYKPVQDRFKDYIALPKENSYQSLHTTLLGPNGFPIEIQIRTWDMHRLAENGIAAHWLYKYSDLKTKNVQQETNQWLQDLLDMQQNSDSSLEFIESVKLNLAPDKVYVFTPEGDIINLPQKSTPVDFAYYIHSEIGNTCVAVKINKHYAPLSIALSNGQTVEIVTSSNSRPNMHWLNFVITSKAKNGIRDYLKGQQKEESVRLGKKLLEQSLNNCGASIKKITTQTMSKVIKNLKYRSRSELFKAIGLGNQIALVVAKKLLFAETNVMFVSKKNENVPLTIKGTEGMVLHFAECCRPIPGDNIVGYIKSGQGIIVHVEQCKYVVHYHNSPEKYVSLSWQDKMVGEFKVELVLKIVNKRGVLALLAGAIADLGSNIDNVTVDQGDGEFYTVCLTIGVKDRKHLEQVIKKISSIKYIISAERKEDNLLTY